MLITKFDNLQLKECKNTVFRKKQNRVYYFDDKLIWKSEDIESAFNDGIKGIKNCFDGSFDANINYADLFDHYSTNGQYCIDKVLAQKIIVKLEEGDHISKIIELAKKTEVVRMSLEEIKREKEEKQKSQNIVDKFIISIEKPNIYRNTENQNTNTFDFIEVIVNISVYFHDKTKFAKEHKKEIGKMVLNKIENDKKFKKFGIPISFLALKNATISKNNFIRYLFEIKSS